MIDQEAELEATPERKLLLKLMADSRGSFALGLASIRAYLLSGDNTFRKNFESRWAVNQERFKQLSDSSHLFTSSQKSAWETYSTYIEEFGPIPPKMFLLRSSNDWNKANYWLGTKAAPRAEKITVLLAELSKLQNALADIDIERLKTAESRLETVSALMSIIGIIVGVSIAIYLSRIISVQLAFMVSSAKRISEGDLTGATVSLGAISDFNIVAEALNKTQSSLNTLINRITHSSKELSGHSKGLEVLVQESQTIINTQQQDTNLIATAMSEMGMTVREVARNTTEAAEAAAQADESSNRGHKVVVDTVDSINSLAKAIENAADTINQLGEETNAVDTILVSISGIADQTNLLALNAAIEAARAGEQGRGFAVVADEVRTLAGRTQESTIEIRAMLDRLKSGASNAVSVMELGHKQAQGSVEMAGAAKDNLQDITSTVNKIKDMNTQIATAAEEQSVVADEMTRNVSSITSGAELIVKHTSSCIEGSNAVAALASQLAEGVAEFKVKPANT
jgi:methyl-accepting chemotaxis protein